SKDDLNLKTLFDDQASKAEIIKAFAHFDAAEDGDTCLFHFSGHGSQVPAPKEFRHLEPDGHLETILCHDSRLPGGKDLADKEIAYLFKSVNDGRQIHFVAIFDCCHSGNNSRDVRVVDRMAETNPTPTFLKDFHGHEHYTVQQPDGSWKGKEISSRHVHLAACKAKETAKEMRIGTDTRGVFTYSLISLLEQYPDGLAYQEIAQHLQARIGSMVSNQSPQIFATKSEDKQRPFLGLQALPRPITYAVNFDAKKGAWFVNAGSVHGMPAGNAAEISWNITTPEGNITAGVGEVGMTSSRLTGTRKLDQSKSYTATIANLPNPKVRCALVDGDDTAAQNLIVKASKDFPSTYYEITREPEEADYWIRAFDNTLRLTFPNDERPVFRRLHGYTDDNAKLFLSDTESVARWQQVKQISNPNTSLKPGKDFTITLERIIDNSAWLEDDETPAEVIEDWQEGVVLRYDYDRAKPAGEQWQQPAFRMKVKNTGGRKLYFSAVNLQADYRVSNRFLALTELDPGEEDRLADRPGDGNTYYSIPLEVADAFMSHGVNEVQEQIRLFVSTEEISTDNFNQAALKMDENPKPDPTTKAGRNPAKHPPIPDWMVVDIDFTVVRPSQAQEVASGRKTKLGEALEIELPEGVSCMAALNCDAEVSRNLSGGQPPLPPGWDRHPLGDGFANQAPVDTLEHYNTPAGASELITADSPIKVKLGTQPEAGAFIVPTAYDAETGLFLPIGYCDKEGNVMIESLPDPTPSGTRSLGGSIKIFFQKKIGKYLPFVYDHPQLASAEVKPSRELEDADQDQDDPNRDQRDAAGLRVIYSSTKAEDLQPAVNEASNIVIFMHGIIGDTTEMPKVYTIAKTEDGRSLQDQYDLILTFDYENLETSIEDTAGEFKQRLEAVGLTAGHGKRLDIIAHSMGGLVSRWFIEKLDGSGVISHLYQFGTPNQGSPYGSLYEMATPLLASAVNGAAFLQPYILPLNFVGKFLDKMFTTLKQMQPDSDFLKSLNDGSDPGIPYTIVAGNTQLIPYASPDAQAGLLKKVIARFKKRGHYDALDLLLFKAPNDIAVSVDSISQIPGAENRQHPPRVLPAACDHISYFAGPAALEVLLQAVLDE
ncbi:MAG: caspase family protein, partial [Lewinella sp.]|nr:caspase family protein [Lewinella sp.]